MRNIRLQIAFDGSSYCGWQRQLNGETIQGVLENRLSRMCDARISLHAAGRTDAGVHALGMVANFHTKGTVPVEAFHRGLNSMLPADIRIIEALEVDAGFHSRYSAVAKTYRYDLFSGILQLPQTRLYVAHLPGPFDPEKARSGLAVITGTHDFSSFERSGSRDMTRTDGRGAVRTIFSSSCTPCPDQDDCWSFSFTGDGFLRQMVRNLVGTLVEVARGKISTDGISQILAAKDRNLAAASAPACGLFLEKVHYSDFPPSPTIQD